MPKDPFGRKGGGFKGFGQKAFGGKRGASKKFKPAEVRPPDLETDQFEQALYKIKDPAVTKRVLSLKEQFPNGTVPELVTMDWLNRQQMNYIYQAQFGKTSVNGRIAPDFVVNVGGSGAVWEVQGNYFHTHRKNPESDRRRKRYFMNREYGGMKIRQYVEIWESRIYNNYPFVFEMALAGIDLGP